MIDWSTLQDVYGVAAEIPELLERAADGDQDGRDVGYSAVFVHLT
ncbi:hypothetical protein [Streptacidiphilus melanogenes]|nr:hypothetical protein [Streptacidiphilus melanogenes]